MPFLTVATALVGIVTALELFDPGIFSTALPLPAAWAALLASWAIYGTRTGRGTPVPAAARAALTVVVGLSTMPLVVFAVPTRPGAALAPLAALAVAASVWALTDPRYADDALQKTRPR